MEVSKTIFFYGFVYKRERSRKAVILQNEVYFKKEKEMFIASKLTIAGNKTTLQPDRIYSFCFEARGDCKRVIFL